MRNVVMSNFSVCACTFLTFAVISSSNKRDADTKRMNYADLFVGQDANEAKIQNRRRKPRTKPANP